MKEVEILKLDHFDDQWGLPSFESLSASGMDVRAMFGPQQKLEIKPWERILVPTGFCMAIPNDCEIQVRPRSGLSYKTSLMVVNSPGTIDADYRGELKIILGNLSPNSEFISHGDRIAQIVLCPVLKFSWKEEKYLSKTARGQGGFGSTGRN